MPVADIYTLPSFPPAPADRPYAYIDMVATIDGKIVSGTREESVVDLGSKLDHTLMKRIEAASDAVLVGAGTLRASAPTWNPAPEKRFVISGSGDLPEDHAFFQRSSFVVTTEDSKIKAPRNAKLLRFGNEHVDLKALTRAIREMGVERLFVLGGSETNAQLIRADLIDELFLTVAPKVKLGRDLPTYAGGEALPREQIQNFRLIEHHVAGDEVFLRYRRER